MFLAFFRAGSNTVVLQCVNSPDTQKHFRWHGPPTPEDAVPDDVRLWLAFNNSVKSFMGSLTCTCNKQANKNCSHLPHLCQSCCIQAQLRDLFRCKAHSRSIAASSSLQAQTSPSTSAASSSSSLIPAQPAVTPRSSFAKPIVQGYGEDIRVRSHQKNEESRRTNQLMQEAQDARENTYRIILWTKVCPCLCYVLSKTHYFLAG